MQYNFKDSGTLPRPVGSASRSLYDEPESTASSATRTSHASNPALYQELVKELDRAQQQVRELSTHNQRLNTRNQHLQKEIAAIAADLHSNVGQVLTRLHQLLQGQSHAAVNGDLPAVNHTPIPPILQWSVPPTRHGSPTPLRSGQNSEDHTSYDFLDRLKRRQPEMAGDMRRGLEATPLPPSRLTAAPAADPLPRSTSRTTPPAAFEMATQTVADPRGRKGSSRVEGRRSPSSRTAGHTAGSDFEARSRALNDFIEELGPEGQELFTPSPNEGQGYSTGAYQRAREQHGSPQPIALWIIAAFLLVVGSFGAGFLVVQPFVRGNAPEAPSAQPAPTTP
jgi:hypothetical protein